MPPVSVELKRAVKAANDIADVVAGYVPVHAAGKVFKAVCPFHNDTRPSLQIDRQFQNFRCWACDARGDVFDFVMKFEKVEFPEALRILAQRANIALEPTAATPEDQTRARLLNAVTWAEDQYRACLMDDPAAEPARHYLGSRKLAGAIVRQFGLGFAPVNGDWLVRRADADGIDAGVLVEVGLIAARDENRGFYDRFRDRVMFPIRDARGHTVGFGGRVLPASPLAARAPKYYNSADTPLFNKSDLLYGLDLARHAGSAAGALAVVEGYTDVMMAHQCGVANVVATMGTALNARHVAQLRRYAPKVVLVFDADAGGMTGVDRALELFIGQDVELAIATLPDGLDPCDLLTRAGGPDVFRKVLATAADALDFKLNQLLARDPNPAVDGTKRIVDAVLGVMALAPPVPNQSGQVRHELMVTRLAHRLGLRQETVWARLAELRTERRRKDAAAERARAVAAPPAPATRVPTKADPVYALEITLLRLLIVDPNLIPTVATTIRPEDIRTPNIRRVVTEMYTMWAEGQVPDLDALRIRLLDDRELFAKLMDQADIGRTAYPDRAESLRRLLAGFTSHTTESSERAISQQMKTAGDETAQLELLRRLQATARPGSN